MTTSRDDAKGAADHGDVPDVEAAFDELGRRAGAALRRPAPENGVGEIARRSRRERLMKTGAISAVVLLLVAGLIVMLSGDGEPDTLVPAETTTENSSVPTPTVALIETTLPRTTPPTTDPATTSTDASVIASPAVTSVTVPWTGGDQDETPMQLLERTVTPSSIGDLHWTVLESASVDEFGSYLYPVRGPRGFMSVRAGELMISEDAVSWRPVTAPFPGRPLGVGHTWGGRFELTVLTDEGSTQYWQSPDLETWSLSGDDSDIVAFADWIDGPGLVTEVGSRPLPWQMSFLPDGSALTSVSVGLDIRGQIAARVGGDEFRQALDDGRGAEIWWEPSGPDALSGIAGVAVIQNTSWQTWAEAKAESTAAFEVELSISGTPDDWVVEVRNPSTGETLGTVRGTISADDLSSTLTALVYSQLHEWFVIDGDTAELVHPDWAGAAGPEGGPMTFAATDDGLIVYIGVGPAVGPREIWRTTDGRTWEQLATAGWQEAAPSWAQMADIYEAPDDGLIAVFSGGRGELAFLTSADGVNWQTAAQPPELRPAREGSGFDSFVHVTEGGFVVVALPWGEDEHFAEIWTSANGDVWAPVDADELIFGNIADSIPTGAGSNGSTPNLVTITRSYEGGREITWIIEVV